ncbi:tetratricopeptide repeat protein [Roseimaritima ulvae]|uniref:Tetratricopeptide repeat protein n=1 Tax=Roseimaritima ulvae TaxID=980254 RepID=A0A5B9QYI1_9BACT|nr:hypothetical protein [Roseimaritima ulvae]QEG39041.1 hypothetical protein UC8_10020 [Roseimaritima ulvae]
MNSNSQSSLEWMWILLAVAAVIAFFSWLSTAAGDAVPLFARPDVVACCVLASLPAGLRLRQRLQGQSRAVRAGIAAAAAAVALVGFQIIHLQIAAGLATRATWPWQVLVAGSATLAAILAASLRTPSQLQHRVLPWSWDVGFLALLLAIPAAYNDSIAQGLHNDLQQSLNDQRVTRACRQSAQLMQLQPQRTIGELNVAGLQQELRQAQTQLQSQLESTPPQPHSLTAIGQRVVLLMQLDRHEQALVCLQPLLHGERFHPIALDYQGLCYQRMEQPQASLAAYQASAEYWREQIAQDADQPPEGLASALRGIGYAARQLNQRGLEERAYAELVAVAPSGENHLLLAQCYQEHQKTDLARTHAMAGKQLSPERSAQADKILSALTVEHFGCLNSLRSVR